MTDPVHIRTQAAQFILDCEARRDAHGHLAVYDLPAGDGGGSFEVAGINDGYHPEQAHLLRAMIKARSFREAEMLAVDFIASYTDVVRRWSGSAGSVLNPGIEVFLRDCCFNRGPKGALRILQLALGVNMDGKFGPITRNAIELASFSPHVLLAQLRLSRENYEERIAPPVGERAKFWNGLCKRWDKAFVFANGFIKQEQEEAPQA